MYMHLKAKLNLAKLNSKIRDLAKADEYIDYISSIVRSKRDPEHFWKFELKALYIRAKHYVCCMEFQAARNILDKDVKLLLDKLFPKDNTKEIKVEKQEVKEKE